jgi:fatty acid elongase 3
MSTIGLDAFYGLSGAALLKTSPWALFDQAWTSVVGYPATEFRFVPGGTPMASFKETAAMITLYYIVIYTGWEYMRKRQPFKLNALFMAHNFILTAVSGALLVLFLEQLIPALWKNGLYNCICGKPGWTNKLVVLYYVSVVDNL